MPSAFRDPKSLSEWIQLDYFRRPRGLRRWRGWLGWGTLVVTAVLTAGVFLIPRGKTALQAGPVSSAHTMFNDRCDECHTNAFQTARRIVPVDLNGVHPVPDEACTKCHDGPKHQEKQGPDPDPSCASCHREHRGRASLARVTDDHCAACHADLHAHTQSGAETAYQNVSGFPTGHPEFRLWRDQLPDPGQLKFNHKVHLRADGVLGPGGKPEVLACSACHVEDSAKQYMRPINYEAHCERCHKLSVHLAGTFPDEKVKAAAEKFDGIPAPHKEPALVRAVLRERLISFIRANPVLAGPAKEEVPFPRRRHLEALSEPQWLWTRRQLTETESKLFSDVQLPHGEAQLFDGAAGCAYCHVQEGSRGDVPRGPDDLPVYKKTALPERWLTHGRFAHDSHRMLNCEECHAVRVSEKTGDVNLPRVDTCARCHHGKSGVRSDCVECHVYHHRDATYEQNKHWTVERALGE